MSKIKIVALFGKSGAGKSCQQDWLVKNTPYLHGIVPATTRPKRENEIEGKSYYFMTEEEFKLTPMLETSSFRNWYYGTPLTSIDKDKINIGVFNIRSINTLLENNNLDVLPIYIECDDSTRLIRQIKRENKNVDCEEICRRFFSDQEDFKKIDFAYFTVSSKNRMTYTSLSIKKLIEAFKNDEVKLR